MGAWAGIDDDGMRPERCAASATLCSTRSWRSGRAGRRARAAQAPVRCLGRSGAEGSDDAMRMRSLSKNNLIRDIYYDNQSGVSIYDKYIVLPDGSTSWQPGRLGARARPPHLREEVLIPAIGTRGSNLNERIRED